ncbi:MAG: chemotaxis protein CheW [Rhodothermales bacterium]|nr:chemotaxis protein CheW [Rhodothermales bacterium]
MSESAARTDLLQLVSFVLEGEEFGIDILKVQEIIRPVAITRVPNAPAFVEGVINLRGRIVPVIDAHARFNLPARTADESSRIVVVEVGAPVVGFMLVAVKVVIRVDPATMEPPPDLAVGVDADYISGVAKLEDRLLILLDVERVLGEHERAALSGADLRSAVEAA